MQVRYHHRFATRLYGFFLDPWDDWGIDFVSLLDLMAVCHP